MPYEMHHRRKVDEFSALPFFGLSARNIAYGAAAVIVGVGASAAIYLSNSNNLIMAIGSFAIMFVCGPLVVAGFKKPSDGFSSYEEKLYLFLIWKFFTRNAYFHSDSIFNDQEELINNVQFKKTARKNARKEREQRD